MKRITSGNKVLALVLDVADLKTDGISAVTDPAWPLQLLVRKHKKGHTVAMHGHKRIKKAINQLQEGLVVIKGEIKATIADSKGKRVGVCTVSAGQCLLFVSGAHKVEVTKAASVYEFKNGPYVDDKIIL